MTGRTIGNYRITSKLGEGSMGVVYRAVDLMVERDVAIKSLKVDASPESLEQLRSEAIALARLNHPSIAQLYTFFREADDCYMVMEYIPGETLEARLRRTGPLAWPEAIQLGRLMLDGLQHAHDQGILHRDIKPANLMLPLSGGVKIMDFGIARIMGVAREATEGRVVGTLGYLAPERIHASPAVPASDQYSAAVTIYEMLTGRLPISAPTDEELLVAQGWQAPTPPGERGVLLPEALEAALMKALDKTPDGRHADARAFADALKFKASAVAPPPAPRLKPAFYPAAAGVAVLMAALAFRHYAKPSVSDDAWRPTPPVAAATPKHDPGPELPATPIPYRPATLAGVQSIFIERLPDGLDELLAAEIAAKVGARLPIQKSPDLADAVLKLTRTTAILTSRATQAELWRFDFGDTSNRQDFARALATQLHTAFSDNHPVLPR
jgi:serine/threonine-protein kinase